jgi:hypothetical protein
MCHLMKERFRDRVDGAFSEAVCCLFPRCHCSLSFFPPLLLPYKRKSGATRRKWRLDWLTSTLRM